MYEKLLAKIAELDKSFSHPDSVFSFDDKQNKALRAVVELHQQINGREANCVACFMNTYDCPTIQAIEKELS
jgi:hypothetical protein